MTDFEKLKQRASDHVWDATDAADDAMFTDILAALDEAARLQARHDRLAAAAQAHVAAWDDSLIAANKTLVALRAALTETPAPEDGGTR